MSAGTEQDILKRLDANLECSICRHQYRDPRVLTCQHSFCTECIRQHVANSDIIKCPLCNDESPLPDKGVEGLKSNFFIRGLIEDVIRNQAGYGKAGRPCTSCDADMEAVGYCEDCKCNVCIDCVDSHNKLRVLKHHKILYFPLEEKSADQTKAQSDKMIKKITEDICGNESVLKERVSILRKKIGEIEKLRDMTLTKLKESHKELLVRIGDYFQELVSEIHKNTAEKLGDIPDELIACEQQLNTYMELKQQALAVNNVHIQKRTDKCRELRKHLSVYKLEDKGVLFQGGSNDMFMSEFEAAKADSMTLDSCLHTCLGYLKPIPSRHGRKVQILTDAMPSAMKETAVNIIHEAIDTLAAHPITKDICVELRNSVRINLQKAYPDDKWSIVVDFGSTSSVMFCNTKDVLAMIVDHTNFILFTSKL